MLLKLPIWIYYHPTCFSALLFLTREWSLNSISWQIKGRLWKTFNCHFILPPHFVQITNPAKWFCSQATYWTCHAHPCLYNLVHTIPLTKSHYPFISIYQSPIFPSKPSSFIWQTISQWEVHFWMKTLKNINTICTA